MATPCELRAARMSGLLRVTHRRRRSLLPSSCRRQHDSSSSRGTTRGCCCLRRPPSAVAQATIGARSGRSLLRPAAADTHQGDDQVTRSATVGLPTINHRNSILICSATLMSSRTAKNFESGSRHIRKNRGPSPVAGVSCCARSQPAVLYFFVSPVHLPELAKLMMLSSCDLSNAANRIVMLLDDGSLVPVLHSRIGEIDPPVESTLELRQVICSSAVKSWGFKCPIISNGLIWERTSDCSLTSVPPSIFSNPNGLSMILKTCCV